MIRRILFLVGLLLTLTAISGCAIGILLFYRDSKTSTVYKSSDSKKNYYRVDATTLSHCGCTNLNIDNYKEGKRDFTLYYNGKVARKSIYLFDGKKNIRDTLRLIATSSIDYSIPFDSLDIAIFNRIDSIAIQKPKGIVYEIKRTAFKGFVYDPHYNSPGGK